MKTKVYQINNKLQLIMALSEISKNPYEYADCTVELDRIKIELLAKILSYSNDFVKFHIKHSEELIKYKAGKNYVSNRINLNLLDSGFNSNMLYNPPQIKQDELDRLENFFVWQASTNNQWNTFKREFICEKALYKYIIEPAYDRDKFKKLFVNRVTTLSKASDFPFTNSDILTCKNHIIYIKCKNMFNALDLIRTIINDILDYKIRKYILLFEVNKVLYVLSEESIESISYYNNSTLKINEDLYKII